MYMDRPVTPEILEALDGLDSKVESTILDLFNAYEALLRTAERDREALLGILDVIGVRLDQVHPDPNMPPGAARAVVMKAFQQYVDDREEMAQAAGIAQGVDPGFREVDPEDVLADVCMPGVGQDG
jgi:hypothetical protein